MFDPEFFPTPRKVADLMFAPYRKLVEDGEIRSVLDPEAGKGDLLKPVLGMRETARPRLYAIEKVAELRAALAAISVDRSWGRDAEFPVRVLGEDVFAYQGRHTFDLVLQNPPFSRGAEHLLRAWELLADGGRLACLLNAETIRNPHTADRQRVAALVQRYGAPPEYLGLAFAEAERRTDVEVALVRLSKPAAPGQFDFGPAAKTRSSTPRPIADDFAENAVARQDFVGNAALAFDMASRALVELSSAWRRAEHYLGLAGVNLKDILPLEHRAQAEPDHVNDLIDAAQGIAWRSIINRSQVEKYFTAKMRKDFDSFMANQGCLDFNKANVLALFETIFMSRHSIADAAIQDVFEQLCRYAPENKLPETWKTNSGYKVNQKVIIPYFIVFDGSFRLSYHREYSALNDVDKALCHVTGTPYEGLRTIERALDEAFHPERYRSRLAEGLGIEPAAGNTATSEFFDLRFFKKGTLHLKFRNRKVWEMFNVAAARGKGWLGPAETE